MNRWVHGGLALCAGFLSTVVALHIADNKGTSQLPGARLGAVRPQDYCIAVYGDRASAVQTSDDAYGWRCWVTINGLVTHYEIDYSKACELLYEAPAYAKSYNVSWPYSWECFRGPATN